MSSEAERGGRGGGSEGDCHRCCSPSAACYADWENQFQRFVVCSRAGCRRDCLPPSAQLVACSIAEFQYSLTEDEAEVRRFLAEHGIEQSALDPAPPAPPPTPDPIEAFRKRRPPPAAASRRRSGQDEQKCVAALKRNPRTAVHARICSRFFSSKRPFCCKHCKECSPLR